MKKFNYSAVLKASILTAIILLLIALPQSPFKVIQNIKKNSAQVELLIPGSKLSNNLSVDSCSEQDLLSLYDNAKNFNVAKSGLNVFKSRLAKEYKEASKSFNALATKVLRESPAVSNRSKTCLLPLKISVNPGLGVDLPDSKLLNISLGEQSLFCSNNKAYLSDNSKFFPIDSALAGYASQIKEKKALTTLKKMLENLQKKKATLSAGKKADKEKLDKTIKQVTLSIAYAQYFSKDAALLAKFFDEICTQTGVVLTPNGQQPGLKPAIPTSTPIKVPTQIPNLTAVPTNPASARLNPPVLSSPGSGTVNAINNIVTIRWSAVSGANSYIIGAVDKTPPNSTDLLYDENYNTLSYDLSVIAGKTYRFWLKARKLNYDRNNTDTYSELSEVVFTVASPNNTSRTPTVVPVKTATPVSTINPVIPSCVSGQTQVRTMWRELAVPNGQTCLSEPQTWTCSNGTWVRSTGSFTYSNCSSGGTVIMPSLASTGPRKTNTVYKKVADGDWRQADGSRAPFNFANNNRDLIVLPGQHLVFKKINFQGSMNIGPIWNYDNSNTTPTSILFEDCTFNGLNINTVGKMQVTVSYAKAGYLSVNPSPDSQVEINNFSLVASAGGDGARISRDRSKYGDNSRTPVTIRDSFFKTTGPSNPGDHRDVLQVLGGSGITFINNVFDLNYGEYSGISPGQNVSLFLEDGTNGSISNIDVIDCWMLGSGSYYLMGLQKRTWTTNTYNINVIRPKLSKGTSPLHPDDKSGFKNGTYKLVGPVYIDDFSPVPLSYFGL